MRGGERILRNRAARNRVPASRMRVGLHGLERSHAASKSRSPSEEYDWSDSVSNLSAKLQRESIRYKEVVELADVLDCDIVWVKRGQRR